MQRSVCFDDDIEYPINSKQDKFSNNSSYVCLNFRSI